ncbi:MAG: 5'/3'-nucleotidase SurE, partial [Acidimicrobiales bacterium]|nr:5'/3'-nucleotidase SurE [Acidimicrobiales bacterium]
MRILVTNDDGIDSVGLHVLANAVKHFGDVTVVAPLFECSGAGASIGTLTGNYPVVHRHDVPALDGLDCWSVSGPPALCVMYAQLGAFGKPFDLIVSGINPGQNVGWSVYHSGTIGA